MVQRVLEEEVNDVVEKKDLHLSAFDKNLLREFVEIFERFEDATDILQGDQYVSISLAVPCYFGLKKHLEDAKGQADIAKVLSQPYIFLLRRDLEALWFSLSTASPHCLTLSLS